VDQWIGIVVGILSATLRFSTPILFAALGETLIEKSGVINLGCEGMMDLAAFSALCVTIATANPWLGVLAAMLCGGVLGLLKGFLSVSLGTNQILNGLAITLLGGGISVVLYRILFGSATIPPSPTHPFNVIAVPVLSEIPVIGPILFQQFALTYIAIALVVILTILMNKTSLGLEIRSTGESPETADAAGINVYLVRYSCLFIGGVLAGIGGACLTIAISNCYLPGVIGGRGFMAVAIVILGNWQILGVFAGSLLFGGTQALQMRLQLLNLGVPSEIFTMLPYVVTIIALVAGYKRARIPGSLAKKFRREE